MPHNKCIIKPIVDVVYLYKIISRTFCIMCIVYSNWNKTPWLDAIFTHLFCNIHTSIMALNKNCLEYLCCRTSIFSNFRFINAVHIQIHVHINSYTKCTFIFALNNFTPSRKGLNIIITKGLEGKSTSGD